MRKPIPQRAATGSAPERLKERAVLAIVLGATALVYARSLAFQFVYDDSGQILKNPYVQSWAYVPQYFVAEVWKHLYPAASGNYYRPLCQLWYLLNYTLLGFRPVGWHATTILLHVVATGLTYAVARKLALQPLTAAAAALVFGVHPIHHEVVAWVSGSTESLFAIPFLSAFLCYLQSRAGKRAKWIALSALLYAVALLCKETAFVLPLLIFTHAWIYGASEEAAASGVQRTRVGSALRFTIPYVPIAVAYLLVRVVVLGGLQHKVAQIPFSTLLRTLPSVLFFYLRQWVWPVGLSEFYDLPYVTRIDFASVVAPLLVVLLVAGALWLGRRRLGPQTVDFATLWMLIALLPVLNLSVFRPDELVHDRYFYLPSFGAAILVALVFEAVAAGGARVYGYPLRLAAASLLLAAALGLATASQIGFWKNDYELAARGVRIAPHSSTARNNLALQLIEQGRLDEARGHLELLLQQLPDNWPANYNFARLNYQAGDLSAAEKYFLRAIRLSPSDPDEYVNLARVQMKTGRLGEATMNFRQATLLRPQTAEYRFVYAVALASAGDCAAAQVELSEAMALDPGLRRAQQQMPRCGSGSSSK